MTAEPNSSTPPESIDGMTFQMVSSTSSTVDPQAPTAFTYHQDGEVIWGTYTGDTVRVGRFVGRYREGRITLRFVHERNVIGDVIMGSADSVVEVRDDERLYLVEAFEKDGVAHQSVCVQV